MMMRDLIDFIRDELKKADRRRTCAHEGEESHSYCGKCGADLRVVTSYECRLCELLAENTTYPAEKCPEFCTACGAPKFTFRRILKKRSKPGS